MPLTVTDLAKRYGSEWVLKQASFTAEEGTIVGIFGPKGCGKSTLLRTIAGLETPNGGSIATDDGPKPSSNAKDGIAYVPTFPASGFLKRAFGGKEPNTVDVADRHAAAIDEALAGSDNVILLDDSLCFFDEQTKRRYFRKIREAVRTRGLAVVFAANNFGDLLTLCDKLIIIADGQVQQEGAPEDIYLEPANRLVASITGRNNLIDARRLSSSKSDLPEFQTLTGEHRLHAQKIDRSGLGAINQNVTLAVRPEHVSISFGASFPEDNLVKASIAAVKFLGPLTLVDLDANGLIIQAYVTRLVGLNIGDECMVGLPPDRIRILKS